jgi:hypothetical protein
MANLARLIDVLDYSPVPVNQNRRASQVAPLCSASTHLSSSVVLALSPSLLSPPAVPRYPHLAVLPLSSFCLCPPSVPPQSLFPRPLSYSLYSLCCPSSVLPLPPLSSVPPPPLLVLLDPPPFVPLCSLCPPPSVPSVPCPLCAPCRPSVPGLGLGSIQDNILPNYFLIW